MKSWICRTQCAVCRVDRNWQCFKYLATALQGDYFVYANNEDEIISYFRTQEYCLDTHLSWLLLSAGSVLRSCSWRCSCTRRSRLGRSSWWRGWTRPGRRPSWSGPGSRAWSFIIMKKLPYYRAGWMQPCRFYFQDTILTKPVPYDDLCTGIPISLIGLNPV